MRTWAWAQDARYSQSVYGDRIHDSRSNDKDLPPAMALGRAVWGLIANQPPSKRREFATQPNSEGEYEPIPRVAPAREVTPVVRVKGRKMTDPARINGTASEVALAVAGVLVQMSHEHPREHADHLKRNALLTRDLFIASNGRTQLDREMRSIRSRDGSAKKGSAAPPDAAEVAVKVDRLRALMLREAELRKELRSYANNAVYQAALVYFGEIASRRKDARECFGVAA